MGALQGSISYARFYVDGDLPDNFREVFTTSVQEGAFQPLLAEEEAEESRGWVNIEHPLDWDFDQHKLFFNEYLNVALRIDKWRIPGNLLRAQCVEAERLWMLKQGKERIGRREKNDIKAIVTSELKQKLLPAMKTIDVSWNVNTGVVRFWNQSARSCEEFMDFFEDTFRLRLIPDSPYLGALQYGLDDDQTEQLAGLEPTHFHTEA
jgi:recombination associated protein RdgC